MTPSNLLPKQGEIYHYPDFFSEAESTLFFESLLKEVPWKHEPIKIFGKEVMQPRLTAWYGDKEYSYSGITMKPEPWNSTLLKIKERIEKIAGIKFNSALLNLYRDNQDSVGWHRDDEKELGRNPVIGSVSLGASRVFHLKHYTEKDLKASVELKNGGFLLMKGETQHFWLHSIPKTKTSCGPRINLTFRTIL